MVQGKRLRRNVEKRIPMKEGPQDEWRTPAWLFNLLNERFAFTVDVAATIENAKCHKFYDRKKNGLGQSWKDETVFCNPPYSNILPWIAKALRETKETNCEIVMLLPVRTGQDWFRLLVQEQNKRQAGQTEFMWCYGRICFGSPPLRRQRTQWGWDSPRFDSIIVILRSPIPLFVPHGQESEVRIDERIPVNTILDTKEGERNAEKSSG